MINFHDLNPTLNIPLAISTVFVYLFVCLFVCLQEALEAYKQQNKFLSSEIVELNTIRSDEHDALKMNSQ